jgi:hypothetical protein
MPSKVRIIAGPRNVSFDHYIEAIIAEGTIGEDHDYFGIEDIERADYVRRRLRTAGRHMDPAVAVKAYYTECTGCDNGGPSCRYHVTFAAYDMATARKYKAANQKLIQGS